MTFISKTIIFFLASTLFIPSLSMADVKKGQKVYKKKLHKKCKLPGSIFARKHTQDEWEILKEEGLFKEETKKICPKLTLNKLTDKQWDHLYDFTYQYSIGGEIPNGCDPK